MINAETELLEDLKDKSILCAKIHFGDDYSDNQDRYNLCKNFRAEDYEEFLKFLDRLYDNGYGGQELFGTVWLTDGTWLERGEYDGSEWWEHKVCPEIPEELQ